jgi:hypothetical protein
MKNSSGTAWEQIRYSMENSSGTAGGRSSGTTRRTDEVQHGEQVM